MTPLQQRFVDEYAKDQDATQAAIRAGYSKKSARRTGRINESNPEIYHAIRVAVARSPKGVSQPVKSKTERDGEGFSHANRVSVLGRMMQHFGLLEDGDEPAQYEGDLTKLTDDELDRIIETLGPLVTPTDLDSGRT